MAQGGPVFRPDGGPPAGPPQRGAFAVSEVLPLQARASATLRDARQTWEDRRREANEAKAHAKQVRANLIVRLRVWGNDSTDSVPIKTSAERQEWADADPEVQEAELAADIAQTVAMAAHGAYQQALEEFGMLRTMLGMERDQFAAERGNG